VKYKNVIDKLKNIEEELQVLRQDAKGIDEKLKVMHELEYNINLQIETLANGPR
jgi:regulator of replication initiation timing